MIKVLTVTIMISVFTLAMARMITLQIIPLINLHYNTFIRLIKEIHIQQ